MAATKPRPYRRILTSSMHRRFVNAFALVALVCYLISILIGDKSSFFWAVFPIGGCGIRTVLLIFAPLFIFILRVGQMHIGARTTASAIHTFKHLFPVDVLQTFTWYIFSAWFFTEIYRWSAPATARLELVKRGRPHERASLNERLLYIYTYHLLLAISQSITHLYYDYDRVPVLIEKRTTKAESHPVESVSKRIRGELPRVIRAGLLRAAFMAAICPLAYSIFLRRRVWTFTMIFARLFWDFPRSAAEPPGIIPPVKPGLFARSLFTGALLALCWETTNMFFSIFLSKPPLKRGLPLTSEAKDPTGSLLDGLKAKKETVRSFAFWELCLISKQFPDRRQAIFNDIDREGGSAWTQILQPATEIVQGISIRINQQKAPPTSKPSSSAAKSDPVLRTLPRLTDPLSQDNILASSPKPVTTTERFGDAFSTTMRSFGDSPDWTPKARARARDVFDRASAAVLSPERKQKLLGSAQDMKLLTGPPSKPENIHPFLSQLLRSPIGFFIQQPYARRLSGVVLDTPTANLTSIVYAIESITALLIASLQEDRYGKVQADLPGVVRLFTETTMTLEQYAHGGLDIHWSDITFPPSSNPAAQDAARRVPDVELVIDSLKSSLTDLLSAFKPYLKDVGLVGKDLRLAREAVGLVEE
ncbi:nucleoporin protein Ndc1-Nup [Aspergillus egyptiacus]|nr:nucleoporin protein Ndc1-Nup [Aspergillus egyptiacus]